MYEINLCIIQARMTSTRFPGKILKTLNGIPILKYVIDAAVKSSYIDYIVIAIPKAANVNDELIELFSKEAYLKNHSYLLWPYTSIGLEYADIDEVNEKYYGIFEYNGDENNVLNRYYHCYKFFDNNSIKIKNIIRLTSDCPLLFVFHSIIDKLANEHTKGNYDYSWNRGEFGFPSGLDVEIFKSSILEKVYSECIDKDKYYLNLKNNPFIDIDFDIDFAREHVTPYMRASGLFKCFEYRDLIMPSMTRWKQKWSIDTIEDYEKIYDFLSLLQMKSTLL